MSKEDYRKVKEEYALIQKEQDKLGYRARKALSENFISKYFCCCLKVKDRLNLSWEEMNSQ